MELDHDIVRRAYLDELREGLPEGLVLKVGYEAKSMFDDRFSLLQDNALMGLFLVYLVLGDDDRRGFSQRKAFADRFPDPFAHAIEPEIDAALEIEQHGLIIHEPRHDLRGYRKLGIGSHLAS